MNRTIDIMTVARAKGVDLPAEWWGWVCPVCDERVGKTVTFCALGNHANNYQRVDRMTPEYRYIGPDLERAENLHHAFTVADALGKAKFGVKVEVLYDPAADVFEASFCGHCSRYATERHLALIAACEAALGIQHEKEIAT